MYYIRYLRSMVGPKPVIMVSAVVAVLNAADELLLMRRADGSSWGLIGGFMELGETLEETAQREVFEETGLTVGRLEFLGVFSSPKLWTFPNGDQAQVVSTAYFTTEVSGMLRLSSEGLELRYFALDALPEPIFPPNLNMLVAIKEKLG